MNGTLNTRSEESWETLLGRLNRLSVTRRSDAYTDIDWDSDEYRLDPTDPRWELPASEPISTTAWYAGQPAGVRARLGCDLVAAKMKTGAIFENVLKRGLLEYAARLPNRSPEFRYSYHEVIEEAQHSLMFQEFVNQTGFDAVGLRGLDRVTSRWIVTLGRRFPELFFLFVLGGEGPIDHVQRRQLRGGSDLHPLLERIMRIHVTEEARHLSFANAFLRHRVPRLGPIKLAILGVLTPVILAQMAAMMLRPPRQIIELYHIPESVVDGAYTDNPEHRASVIDSLSRVRTLCDELGLTRRPYLRLWRILGVAA